MEKGDTLKSSRSAGNKIKIAIFGSGKGTNARNLLEQFSGHQQIEISLIVSNKRSAPILNVAEDHNKVSEVITKEMLQDQNVVLNILENHKIDFIVLAGFMLKIPSFLIDKYVNRIVNIHPSLLPAYGGKGMYGMHVHNAVKNACERKSGITIHYVNDQYDSGTIIFQREIAIDPQDSAENIAAKVQSMEYEWFPRILEALLVEVR